MSSVTREHRNRERRWLAAIGAVGLAAIGLALWLTYDRAPSVRVRWRDDLTAERQAELERRYLLTNGRSPMPEAPRSIGYDLLDTSWWNIRALVNDPGVADTNDIDRERYRVQDGTAPGERWTWLAYQVPGLRDPRAVWGLVIVCLIMAVIGFLGIAAERDRALATSGDREAPADPGDLFDRIFPSAPAPSTKAATGHGAVRFAAAILIVAAVGLPVLETWKALLLAVSLIAVLFGGSRPGWRRPAAAIVAVLAVMGLKSALPRADIAEAHNAFTVIGRGEPLEQGLPHEVFASWMAQFDAVYPTGGDAHLPYTWRAHGAVPKTLYTQSSDAIWRKAKYTRQVDAIHFRTLGEFRGGFANEFRNEQFQYNFWRGDLTRATMPFYVMYELTAESVGSELMWTGQLFWERAGGGFDALVHPQRAGRPIRPEDTGKRVYKAFFPVRDEPFDFELRLSTRLRVAAWFDGLLTVLGVVSVLVLTVRPRLGACLRALALFLTAYLLMMSWHDGLGLGRTYVPHSGGDDGLVHDAWGRLMAMQVGQGAFAEPLQGGEPIYWFTPGTRYVRMVEKLLFGDTNHLFAILVASVPLLLYFLVRGLAGSRAAWIVAGLFLVIPVGNLSFPQYVRNAGIGYGEAIGAAFFLLGLALLLRSQPAWSRSERELGGLALGGAALAMALFVRPNFAFAVIWVGVTCAWASLRRRDVKAVAALALGLGLALWLPLHNWVYGGEFYLISRAGSTISLPITVRDYAVAFGDAVRGNFQSEAVAIASRQLTGWLANPSAMEVQREWLARWTALAHAIRLMALVATCWVVLRWVMAGFSERAGLAVVAGAAILAHVPMLFVHTTFDRYAMLGWDLSLIVLVTWLVGHDRRRTIRRVGAFVGTAVTSSS